MEDKINNLIVLREKQRESNYKDFSKAKKKRHTMGMVLKTLVYVQKDDMELFRKYYESVPDMMTAEQVIAVKSTIAAMTDGKGQIEAAKFVFNTAFGLDSVDSEIADTYTLPEMSKETMKDYSDKLDSKY